MNKHRIAKGFVFHSAFLFILLSVANSGCRGPQTSQDDEILVFGAKVGTLARTIQSAVVFIQSELVTSQPNLRDMQEAHARIKKAYIDLHDIGRVPEELYSLRDAYIVASFECEDATNLAIINSGGDLTSCLAKIDLVVKETEKYMPAPEKTPTP